MAFELVLMVQRKPLDGDQLSGELAEVAKPSLETKTAKKVKFVYSKRTLGGCVRYGPAGACIWWKQ
ncbi:hypothetical protein SDJN02_13451, partial [Cucurbita argyrosperma subsp. argyrosperma]